MSIVRVPFSLTGGGAAAYVPAGAIWLDGSADYLTRTPGSAGNRKTWTTSVWVKLAKTGVSHVVFGAGTSGVSFAPMITASTTYTGIDGTGVTALATSAIHRDVVAWMNIVIAVDTTNATANDRVRMWINGVEQTDFGTRNNPALDTQGHFNNTVKHNIGIDPYDNSSSPFNGYMSEFIMLDGTASTDASEFGEYDTNGNWIPKDPSGLTFGTTGFWLDFADSADLGNDVSGNNNDFTPTSMSSANSTSDRPADKAADDLGNYATWNPLFIHTYMDSPATNTYTNGNLTYTGGDAGGGANPISTIPMDLSVSWYVEVTYDTVGTGTQYVGIHFNPTFTSGPSGGISYEDTGNKDVLGTSSAYGATYTSGDVIGIYYDADNDQLSFYKNGSSQGVAASSVSSNGARAFVYAFFGAGSDKVTLNAGQNAFTGTPPTGAKNLHTANLPAPTVTDPSKYFNTVLYTGNGTAIGSGGKAVTGVGFQPNFVWIKSRSGATDHALYDAVRGTTKELISNSNSSENTLSEGLTAFGSDGFTVGSDAAVNTNSATYVAWCLKANGAGSSNTNGSITSTVSAAAHGGFSIVSYTGTAANATVGHGLSSAPGMIIVKNRTDADDWAVFHDSVASDPATDYLVLNSTAAVADLDTYWNDTAPTASVFSVGSVTNTNGSSDSMIAYCFARTPGLIGIGSYVGNGSTDGPYVVVNDGGSGFRPAWLMLKRTDSAGFGWLVWDAARETYNPVGSAVQANSSGVESDAAGTWRADFTANGFKLRQSANDINASGGTYIYLAFAEYPFGGDGVAQAKAR